jgi:hypothetical protein
MTVAALAAILAGMGPAMSQAKVQTGAAQLLGTWRLVAMKATNGAETAYPLGAHPGGFAAYTPGRVWFMLTGDNRKAPAAAIPTDAEAGSLLKSSAAYTGTYDAAPSKDGLKITVHVDAAVNEGLKGSTRVWFARIDGKMLIVTSPALFVPMTGRTSAVELDYARVE